ncbi:MAG: cytochrome c-type biosis protein [Methanothermobacter sp.]|nr:cytochrome c-type biosis protein [Methanothermobacter sp.]MDN5374865.1 cytochrome c-type biosis protein [Methanothermobacter sp.]
MNSYPIWGRIMQDHIISFTAGILSVLSPCILPVIPVLFSESLIGSRKERFLFLSGFSSLFLFIIILTAIFTASVNYYLLYLRIPASIMLIIMGLLVLSEKPLISIRTPPAENHVLMGLLTAIAWTPCYSPYLIGVIAYSAYTGIPGALVNMALYTLGLTIALIALTLLAEPVLRRLLGGSRDIRRASGALIVVAGIYMLYQLIPLP